MIQPVEITMMVNAAFLAIAGVLLIQVVITWITVLAKPYCRNIYGFLAAVANTVINGLLLLVLNYCHPIVEKLMLRLLS